MTSVVPAELKTEMLPPSPTGTVTALAVVCPGIQLRFDATGLVDPVGDAVAWPGAEVCVTVALSTTAVAVAGTQGEPATRTERASPCAQGVVVERVSRSLRVVT